MLELYIPNFVLHKIYVFETFQVLSNDIPKAYQKCATGTIRELESGSAMEGAKIWSRHFFFLFNLYWPLTKIETLPVVVRHFFHVQSLSLHQLGENLTRFPLLALSPLWKPLNCHGCDLVFFFLGLWPDSLIGARSLAAQSKTK